MAQTETSGGLFPRPKRGRKKRRKESDQCLVCGDRSVGINFGVHTCSPCKAFFRRNAVKLGSYEFLCERDGDCPITSGTRRLCNCCRLAKCFRVGMDRHAIRTEGEKEQRNQLIALNRQKRLAGGITIQPVNLLKQPRQSSSCLSSTDQTMLTNILRAYDSTCIALRYEGHLNVRTTETVSLEGLLNSFSHMYIALVGYIKLVPEFADLPVQAKALLLRNNLTQVFRINNALVVHATGIVDDADTVVFKHLFPRDLYVDLCRCLLSLFPFVYDPIFIKLLVVVLIFSTSLSTRFDGSEPVAHARSVVAAQDSYIELLWRYILYRCSTQQQSVQLLTAFVSRLLHSQIINEQLSQYISQFASTRVNHLEPIMRAMWLDETKKS